MRTASSGPTSAGYAVKSTKATSARIALPAKCSSTSTSSTSSSRPDDVTPSTRPDPLLHLHTGACAPCSSIQYGVPDDAQTVRNLPCPPKEKCRPHRRPALANVPHEQF